MTQYLQRSTEILFAVLVLSSYVVNDKGPASLVLAGMVVFGAIMTNEYIHRWFKISRPHYLLLTGSIFWILNGL